MNKFFILIGGLIEFTAVGIYIISLLRSGNETDKLETYFDIDKIFISWFGKALLCLIITVIYLLFLCAKVSPDYITRPLVMFSWLFWIILMVFSALAYIIKKIPIAVMALPLLIYMLTFETVIDGKSFFHNYDPVLFSPETVKALDENIIRQVKEAEEAGKDSVEILVPVQGTVNWPFAISDGGERISTTLYRHGIINKNINIILVPDLSINDEFNLP